MEGNLGLLIAVGGIAATILGHILATWRWIANSRKEVELAAEAEIQKIYTLVETRSNEQDRNVGILRDVVIAHQLDVAKHYASDARLREMESKFTTWMEKLIDRFDKLATDFNKAVGRMEQSQHDRES